MSTPERGAERPSMQLTEAAQRLVADWPPLTEEQQSAIRAAARTAVMAERSA